MPSTTSSGEAPRPPGRHPAQNTSYVPRGQRNGNGHANGYSNGTATVAPPAATPTPAAGGPKYPKTPGTSGLELWHCLTEWSNECGWDVNGYIIHWGRQQGFKGLIKSWGPTETAAAYEEVYRKLDEVQALGEGDDEGEDRGEAYDGE